MRTHSVPRDIAFGRYYARRGGSRVFTEAEQAPSAIDRAVRFTALRLATPVEHTLPAAPQSQHVTSPGVLRLQRIKP